MYIHIDGMKSYNFRLFGKKEYLNVKSILSPKLIEAARGETIEFIATGGRARDALDASALLVDKSPPCFPIQD